MNSSPYWHQETQSWVGKSVTVKKIDHDLHVSAPGPGLTRILKEEDTFYASVLTLLESQNPDRVIDSQTLGVTPIILAAHMKQKRR